MLINSTSNNQAEKDSPPNQTLRGFDFIDRVKSLLEAECPGVVSCADVLSLVTRDSIVATVRIQCPSTFSVFEAVFTLFPIVMIVEDCWEGVPRWLS